MARKSDRDWKAAGERALTTWLVRVEQLADGCGDTKQAVDILKALGDIVGAGVVLGRKPAEHAGSDDDDDE